MTNILEISDGTTTVNLLSASFGFCLNDWNPAIAQPKGGGVFQSSSLSQGRKLVDKKFEDIQDAFNFDIKGSGQPETITYITGLIDLLEQATDYWTGTGNKVWLKAKADCEEIPRYALISNYNWPELKYLYGNTFFNATEIASMINVDLGIEHKLWSGSIPGESECQEINSVQDWQYEELWQLNTTLTGTIGDLIQTANGDIYAISDTGEIFRSVDGGATWPLLTTLASPGFSLLQTTNGDIYAGATGEIFRSTDGGATWPLNTALPTSFVFALLQTTNGDIYANDDAGQLLRSVDDGASWAVNTTVLTAGSFALLQTTNEDIYTGDIGQIWRSVDDGASWQINLTLPSAAVGSLLQTTNGDIYAGTTGQMFRSEDNGASWAVNSAVFTGSTLDSMQTINGDIYVGEALQIWRSRDNGASWQIDTTVPAGNVFSLLQTANGNIYASDSPRILQSIVTTNPMGRSNTCNNEVYISNKQNIGNLTHVKIDDGGVFTDIFPISSFPQDLLPAVPVVDDAIYFGIENITNAGPFSGLVFDINDPITLTSSYTIVWEYWNGAWVTLIVTDNTNTNEVFRALDVRSVHWVQPSDWATTAVDSITGYWIRARVSALVGTITPPTQQNRDIYTIVNSYIEVAALQVEGHISALIKEQLQNQSDKDGRNGSGPDLWDNRIICGLRDYNRGDLFQSYINMSETQNPIGITITDTGPNATFTADTTAPANQNITYNPAGVEAMATQATIAFGPTIARDFYGKFHAFVRVQRSSGTPAHFDIQLQIVSGSGGIQFTTESKQAQTTIAFELLDFGQIEMPVSGALTEDELGDVTEIRIQAAAATGTPNLIIYDLILISVDEWSIDAVDFANTDDSIVGNDDSNPKYLDIDSITNPKVDIRSLVKVVGNDQITSAYDPISPSSAVLKDKVRQRLWFLAAQTDQTGTQTAWIAPPEISHSVQLFKNERYLTLSKGIE